MVISLQEPFKPPPIPAPHVELAVTEPLLIVILLQKPLRLPPIPAPEKELAFTEPLLMVILLQKPLRPPPIPAPAPSPSLLAFKIPVVVFEALIIIS